MKRKRNIRKKKNNLLLLILLVLGISVGYAFISSTISINGIAGINNSVFDIHWENVVPNSASTVTAETPGISEHATKVSFSVNLALPGDFYEFDVDAKNDGDWAGTITKIDPNIYKVVEDGEDDTVPSYIKTSIVYKGTNIEPQLGDILYAGEKQTYTIRVEFDREAEEVPDEDFTIKVEEDITYSQWDTRGKYLIKFDPNGGSVVPSSKEVEEGGKIGSLPTPTYADHKFVGWFTGATDGTKIDANTIPVGNVTYYAHWTSSFATFDTGENVNVKFKTLAGNTGATYTTSDTYITSVVKSSSEPSASNKTAEHIVSIEGSEPIYAWFENGTIYWWSAADYVYLNTDASGMFSKLTAATSIDTSFYTNLTENMSGMFSTTNATSLDLSGFDTGNVTNMNSMFATAGTTSLDLSSFDTSKVTDMSTMFASSKATSINLSSFDTKNVQYMSMMFAGSSVENLDLGGWNIENVSSIANMFAGSKLVNLDMSGWHYKKINALSGVFSGASFLRSVDMSDSNFESIQYFSYVFQGNGALQTVNLDNVDTSNITSLDSAFQGCSSLTNLDLSDFETSNLLYMSSTFQGCSSLTSLDLTSFDTLNVIYMSSTFQGCSNLTTITVSDTWTTANVQGSGNMFAGCNNLVGGNGTIYDSNHIDKEYAHYDYGTRDPGYFNRRDASSPDDFYTVTFNPKGGTVDVNTKQVRKYDNVGELPTATKGDEEFGGWYTEDGEEVTENFVPIEDTECYANWLPKVTVTYDANEGDFGNNTLRNVIEYENQSTNVTKYSHTSNINDEGVADGTYGPNLNTIDTVTIDGADSIDIEVWYSTETYDYYDWLAIYPKGVDPTKNNYSEATISNGKLYGGTSTTKPSDSSNYHKTYTVNDDTAKFFFTSNSYTSYYGYYAIITGIGKYYVGNADYIEPNRDNYVFTGWKDKDGNIYKDEEDVRKSLKDVKGIKEGSITLYAQWKEVYTITFNPNGGSVDPTSKTVIEGNKIGTLPVATRPGHVFEGWYYPDLLSGVKITSNFKPSSSHEVIARWDETGAIFDTGPNVNVKFKTLANPGETISGWGAYDTNVLAIKKSTIAPPTGVTTENVEAPGSVPILAWFDDTDDIIYWYTTADKVYINEDATGMFAYFKAAQSIDTTFDTSLTTTMYYMFIGNIELRSIDLSGFNTSNVTDIRYMLGQCTSLTSIDASSFDTTKVTEFWSAFYGTTNLRELNVSNWDLSNWTYDNLGVMRYILGGDSWNIKSVIADNVVFPQNMDHAFSYFESMEYVSLKNVDTSNVTTFSYMFNSNKKLEYADLSDFDTRNVTDMSYAFYDCYKLRGVNLDGWDTSKVTTLRCMFNDCHELEKLDLSHFDTSNVSDMYGMVGYAEKLSELNLSNFDFRKWNAIGIMPNILLNRYPALKIVILDNTKFGTVMHRAFADLYYAEVISLRNVDTSDATTMYLAFESDTAVKKLYLDSFDTRKVTNMEYMFQNMTSLESISVSDNFVVSQVSNSSGMFYNSPNIVGGAGTLWNSSFIDKSRARYDKGLYDPGYFNDRRVEKYNITFNPNGGTVVERERYVWAGEEIGTLPVPTRDGYTFEGWTNDIIVGTTINSTYIPSSDMTLVAKWSKANSHTITLDPNGGEVNPSTIIVENGQPIRTLSKPAKIYKIFEGWYTDSSYTTKIENGYVPTSDMTLIAKWRDPLTYTITFNPNGGTVDETTRSVTEGRAIGKLPTPTWNRHYFIGWYEGLTDGWRVFDDDIVDGNKTYYARWRNIYTATLNPNGGAVSPNTVDVIEGVCIGWRTLPRPTPPKEYKKFQGWWTDLQTGRRIDEGPCYAPTGNETYYAKWYGWDFVNESSFDDPSQHLSEQQWAYYDTIGQVMNGWIELPDLYGVYQKYYFENGIAHIGWLHINGEHYFLSDEDDDGNGYVNCGAYRNETKLIGNRTYTFDSDGKCTDY